jgi:ArsR family metal-binding transcriptional regulator
MMAEIPVPVSGILRYAAFKKVVPDAAPPGPRWYEIMGKLCIESVRSCVSDVVRLRMEVTWEHSLSHLTPPMARVIRGGSYRPEADTLVFEEEHRLLAVSPHRLVISRADDLLDAWIMLRSFVDLVCATSDRQALIKPEIKSRRGIGAIEIFKRLPGTNCGRCGHPNCMELAMRLFMGHGQIEECAPLFEPAWTRHREALIWLLDLIGPCPGHNTNALTYE